MSVGATVVAAFISSVIGAILSTFTALVANRVLRTAWSQPLDAWITEECRRLTPAETHRLSESQQLKARLNALRTVPSRNPLAYRRKGKEHEPLRLRQSEWRQLRFRLLENHPAIYGEIDRMESEAEFRFAIALPAIILGIAAGERAATHGALWTVGGVLVGLALVRAGVAVSGTTERTMVDLVQDRVVRLPVMDAIRDADTPAGDAARLGAG